MELSDIIKNAIQTTGKHPFLFVGSGISKRYLGTEKWDELLKIFCSEFSGNDFQYNIYENEIDLKDYYGMQPAIATLLEKDYNRAVLTNEKYVDFRAKHREALLNQVSALKIAIAEHLSSATTSNDSSELELFKKLAKRSIYGIITTNYDTFLETLFPHFTTYIGQEELLFSKIDNVGEIYKIHGSVTDPRSLILTSKDYELFEKKSAYLTAKLLTIFLEYPIIFLGYSLNDRNIRNIFSTISDCLSQQKLDKLKNQLIFVEFSADETISCNLIMIKT